MKSLSQAQLVTLVQQIQPLLLGAQLQDVWSSKELVILELYQQASLWLCFDLTSNQPQMVLLQNKPALPKEKKPAVLFLHAHGKNRRLTEISVNTELGRVLILQLGDAELEVILVPRMPNLTVRAQGRSVSWRKPKELAVQAPFVDEAMPVDWQEHARSWLESKVPSKSSASSKEASFDRAIQKKTKALESLMADVKSQEAEVWRQLGEELKIGKDLSNELGSLYDKNLSRSENIERAFEKAKLIEKKALGTQQRIKILQAEIESLKNQGPQIKQTKPMTKATQVMQKWQLRGRKLALDDQAEAVIGKSADDNLDLLRRAQSWDLWLHLRDYPGAYAIVMMPKGYRISDQQLRRVAQWLIKESVKAPLAGTIFDVLVAETKFVRPIKGAKKGLVSYSHTRTLSVRLE